jgi:hypothetical protein
VSASLSLEPSPSSLERARQFTSETLHVWGRDTLKDVACLIVAELVTNAFEHARTAATLDLQNFDGRVLISVRDGSGRTRRRRKPRRKTTPFRGLARVTRFASDWGVQATGNGKVVWALLTEFLHVEDTAVRRVRGLRDFAAAAYGGFSVYLIDEPSPEPQKVGRAIITAPDGSRAWLVWEATVWRRYLREIGPPDDQRWGAWSVGMPLPLTDGNDDRAYFLAAIQKLRPRWEAWRQDRT